ncbi:unnamed protein product [Calypogeia fissa]
MWSFPLQILSDRDSRFTRHFWKALFRLSRTDLRRGSAYHHEILRWAHKDNPLSVVLETPESMGVGTSYHVSRLKKFVADTNPNRQQVLRPDALLVEDAEEYEVEAILDHRYKRRLGKQLLEYLVKWIGYDQAECTWEPEENLMNAGEVLGSYHKRSGLPPI